MTLRLRCLTLCFLTFFSTLHSLSALSLREGRHENFTRLVFDVPQSTRLLSQKSDISKEITLTLKGSVCQQFKALTKVNSTVIKSWNVEVEPSQNQCHVTILLHEDRPLKRVFVLDRPQRLVVDLLNQLPVMKDVAAPEEEESNIDLIAWQMEPPKKPTTYLFHPFLLEKPFRPTIVIDAGHGGHDPGSISCRGNYEKNVTLRASQVIAKELKNVGRYHVVLTRNRDIFVPKRERFAIARDAKADFLISVHADNHPSKKLRGLTIYTLSAKASDKEAARLSKQENKSEFLEDLDFTANTTRDVSSVLIDIAQRASKNTALMLAENFHNCLSKDNVGKLMTLRSADLAVLKAPDTPSILVELGYLSNVKDEKLVRSVQYQKKLAQSLINALDRYFKKA